MRAYARRAGFQVVGEFEEAHTATLPFRDRPQGARIYGMMRRGEFDALVVHELDRSERGDMDIEMPVDFMLLFAELHQYGVELHSCDEGGAGGPVADSVETMVKAWKSNKDNIDRAKKSKEGRRAKVDRGLYPGNGPRCYGYEREGYKGDARLVVCEEEARTVRQIFTWYAWELVGVVEIADRLTRLQVPSYGDKETKGKEHGPGVWSPGMIYSILKRETYAGVWYAYRYQVVKVPGQRKKVRTRRGPADWVPVEVPAIIDRATWDETQRRLMEGARMAARNTRHEYLMGRRLTCSCGYHVQGKPCHANGKVYLYYTCNGNSKTLTARDCRLPRFRAADVDAAVWEWVRALLMDPERVITGWQRYQAKAAERNRPLLEELARVRQLIAENQEKVTRLLDVYLAGSYAVEVLNQKKAELERIVSDLERREAELSAHLEAKQITEGQVRELITFAHTIRGELELDELTFEERRGLVDRLDLRGILSADGDEKTVYITCHAGDGALSLAPVNSLNTQRQVTIAARLVLTGGSVTALEVLPG